MLIFRFSQQGLPLLILDFYLSALSSDMVHTHPSTPFLCWLLSVILHLP